MIHKIIFKLDSLFPKVNFDISEVQFGESLLYQIEVDDFEFYMTDEKFSKWTKVLRVKYPNTKWYCCYRNPIKNIKKK